jgi:hypothetical protein
MEEVNTMAKAAKAATPTGTALTREAAYALLGNSEQAKTQAAREALIKSMREAGNEAQTFTEDELKAFGFGPDATIRGRTGGDIEHAKRLTGKDAEAAGVNDGTMLVILSSS